MEDYQEQEYEFLRRLEEEQVGRADACVKRGPAAGAGLTVLSLSPTALAARKKALADPPMLGRLAQAVRHRQGGEEGRPPQRDRAAARLGELRRDHQHVLEEVRHPDHERQPGRQLGAGEPGDPLAQGRLACSRRRRRQRLLRDRRRERGALRQVLHDELQEDPARDEGRPWLLGRRLLGRRSRSASTRRRRRRTPPKTWKDLLKPEYKNKVALNGSPLSSGSAVAGVFSASLANGGSAERHRPGDRLLRAAEERRQLHPGADDARRRSRRARRRSRSTGTTSTSPTGRTSRPRRSRRSIPSDGVYGALLLPGRQRDRSAPVGGAAVAGVPLLRPGPAALAEGVLAPGAASPTWSARKVVPKALIKALPSAAAYSKVKFASVGAERRRHGPRSRPSGRRRSARSTLSTTAAQDDLSRPAPAGRERRLSLAWLGVVPFLAYATAFLLLPAANVLIGAFQSTRTAATRSTTSGRSSSEPYRDRVQEQHRGEPRDGPPRRHLRAADRVLGDPGGHAALDPRRA